MILAAITTHKRRPEMVGRALRSVIAQTFTDWNCVVVDDSPADWPLRDDVRKMVEGYARQDSRIRYVAHGRNYGAQRARNTALSIANNTHGGGGYDEYIGYLDDDDEWLPEKLEKMYARFQECGEDTGLVYCRGFSVCQDPRTGKEYLIRGKPRPSFEGNVYGRMMLGDFVGTFSNPLMRTKYLVQAGGMDENVVNRDD